MAKDQQDAAVTHCHGHALAIRNFALVEHPTQQQHQCGVEVQDESLKRSADVLEAQEI